MADKKKDKDTDTADETEAAATTADAPDVTRADPDRANDPSVIEENEAKIRNNLAVTGGIEPLSEDDRQTREEKLDEQRRKIAEEADANELHLNEDDETVDKEGNRPTAQRGETSPTIEEDTGEDEDEDE